MFCTSLLLSEVFLAFCLLLLYPSCFFLAFLTSLLLLACPLDLDSFDAAPDGRPFSVPVGLSPGSPEPLGPDLVAVKPGNTPQEAACTINFAVSGLE